MNRITIGSRNCLQLLDALKGAAIRFSNVEMLAQTKNIATFQGARSFDSGKLPVFL